MKLKQLKTAFFSITIMSILFFSGCGEKAVDKSTSSQENSPSVEQNENAEEEAENDLQLLTVGIMPDIDSIPFIVAMEEGYFAENVKLEIFKSPMDRDSALSSGGVDGTISDVLAVCLAQEGNFKAYITSMTNGRYGIVTYPEASLSSPKDLEGKEVAMSLNTVIEYVTDRIVIENGGDPSLVKKVSVPQIPSRLELLDNKKTDAIAMPEPFLEAAQGSGNILLAASGELNINPGIMLFTEAAIEEKEAELKAFYEAYNKAVEYINTTDQEAFMPYVIAELGLPESAAAVELPEYDLCRLPDRKQVENAEEWLHEKDLIKNDYEYEDLVREIK